MEIYYMYTKRRKDFGRHARFDDEPAEVTRQFLSRFHSRIHHFPSGQTGFLSPLSLSLELNST